MRGSNFMGLVRPVLLAALLSALFTASSAWAKQVPVDLEQANLAGDLVKRTRNELREFRQAPARFLNKRLKKMHNGQEVSKSSFSEQDIQSRSFVEKKHQWKVEKICTAEANEDCPLAMSFLGKAPSFDNDNPANLIDDPENMMLTLDEVEDAGLLRASLAREKRPWSDHYWPIYQGMLGARYADPEHWNLIKWLDYFQFIVDPINAFFNVWSGSEKAGDSEAIDNLSPAEKYDLLIGTSRHDDRLDQVWQAMGEQIGGWVEQKNPQGFLGPHQWLEGLRYYNLNKDDEEKDMKVEAWMGICHGWAAASYVMDRPTGHVDVPAADNPAVKIRFYPADIKALTSYLWAERQARMLFVGGRCSQKHPEMDEESGRVIDQDCFDTNPHTWHMAVTNQLGKNQRSFVMDATFDYEVWNHPVVGYRYVYFDPLTHKTASSWRSAAREREDKGFVEKDTFKKFRVKEQLVRDGDGWKREWRSDYYSKVVGVSMEVEYLVENLPSHRLKDDPRYDMTHKVTYLYDLEIDESNKVVGGEWYSNSHPDFLWNVPEWVAKEKAYHTPEDGVLEGEWDPRAEPLPESWREWAMSAAIRRRAPLGRVVDALIKASREN